MRVSGVSRVSTHGTPGRGNGITEIAENSVTQAVTEPPTENIHDISSLPESENTPNPLRDSELRSEIGLQDAERG